MHSQQLVGAYSIESYWTSAASVEAIQRIVEKTFGKARLRSRYLDEKSNVIFDEEGKWGPLVSKCCMYCVCTVRRGVI
jgi:hypothetical protein